MQLFDTLSNGLGYLWMVLFIMITAGIAKEYNLFVPVYSLIKNKFGSNKIVVFFLSAIGGVLPIEGRVTVSAGLLDTVAPQCGHGRQKMGIVDYLSTHHYYMWSPLEKTVLLPIAAFGLTYAAFINMIAPVLFVSLIYIGWYIWFYVKEEEIIVTAQPFDWITVLKNVVPMFLALGIYISVGGESNIFAIFGSLALYYIVLTKQWNWKKLLNYVNWEVLITVALVIVLGNYFKSHMTEYQNFIKTLGLDPATFLGMTMISLTGFLVSFLMGSSGKFIAIAVLMSQVFGIEYFLWFFAIDYAGYLLSPTHKCVMVGNRYFGTPFKTYYLALGGWILLMLITTGIMVFLL